MINLFSKRQKKLRGEVPEVYTYDDLNDNLRTQIIYAFNDAFDKNNGKKVRDVYEEIRKISPLLSGERKHLIELCLKYGFRYKAIANAMGKRVSETSKEIKSAIEDLKNLINSHDVLVSKKKIVSKEKEQNQMTEKQSLILKLRFEKKQSFTTIAQTLELSQKEVHNEFVVAYKLSQQNKFTPLNN